MKFNPTPLPGLQLIEIDRRSDDRGFFARIFCEKEFADAGIDTKIVQLNNSFNVRAGTLRGMRYQLPPHAETKVIRCLHGAMFDMAVDVRPDSPTFKQWYGVELSGANRSMLCIPPGFAHGYITLAENTEVLYMVSTPFAPASERGLRYNDPAFRISLPHPVIEIAPKDLEWPDFSPETHGTEMFRGIA